MSKTLVLGCNGFSREREGERERLRGKERERLKQEMMGRKRDNKERREGEIW